MIQGSALLAFVAGSCVSTQLEYSAELKWETGNRYQKCRVLTHSPHRHTLTACARGHVLEREVRENTRSPPAPPPAPVPASADWVRNQRTGKKGEFRYF
ncbi:hypothetical protein J6590_053770 [Homalodisca vitripennis]|nr:hypothetical protein J6590_053770 [Homalodisca vitripennis]